jgi:putative sterol carrier protein
MPLFPSEEWCEAAIALVNADPERAVAAAGWNGDLGAVVESEAGKLDETFVAYVVPEGDRIGKFKVLPDPDDLEELEPAYVIRGPYSVWKALLQGTMDPVEAIVRRRIRVQGDVQPLIERARFRGIVDRMLRQLETHFADE